MYLINIEKLTSGSNWTSILNIQIPNIVKQGLISDVVMMVAVMQLAMPVGTLTVSIAAEYDSDYQMAADSVFVSTLLSIITLPLIAYLLKLVL